LTVSTFPLGAMIRPSGVLSRPPEVTTRPVPALWRRKNKPATAVRSWGVGPRVLACDLDDAGGAGSAGTGLQGASAEIPQA